MSAIVTKDVAHRVFEIRDGKILGEAQATPGQ